MMEEELCYICDEPTGRAGKQDDSLYAEDGTGPYCEGCWGKKIYVASSWRNEFQPGVVNRLRDEGHEVYDFRNPDEGDHGFHWSEIDPNWETWTPARYRKALKHPIAIAGFQKDHAAMEWADIFVGVMPFGRSASIEMGWAAGRGKKTILLLHDGEPELMVKEFDFVCCDMGEVMQAIRCNEQAV